MGKNYTEIKLYYRVVDGYESLSMYPRILSYITLFTIFNVNREVYIWYFPNVTFSNISSQNLLY